MLIKQINTLCITKNCFLFESRVYEILSDKRYKYRVLISDDDYDYVTDKKLKLRLDKFIKNMKAR